MSSPLPFDFPPYLLLMQVLLHCPKAGSTYMQLWSSRGKDNRVRVYKEDCRQSLFISLVKFRNDLLLLMREGLIAVDEGPNSIDVQFLDEQVLEG